MKYEQHVIAVDMKNRFIGTVEKLEAHRRNMLHRAFSVFLFNEKGEMLLQQRADTKYHSGGLWTNACCSHPELGENCKSASSKRVAEELGVVCSDLYYILSFYYQVCFQKDLFEHEIVTILYGVISSTTKMNLNKSEVKAVRWISEDALRSDMQLNSSEYTYWFKRYIDILGFSPRMLKSKGDICDPGKRKKRKSFYKQNSV
ncbi:isopentenyl-diphosphate Delta-isomerase [Candidatus Babeliales bacterium]|nr:isopentenyl-diphosphate Delta-isomerase [Candidatus Babeliales bacterium]